MLCVPLCCDSNQIINNENNNAQLVWEWSSEKQIQQKCVTLTNNTKRPDYNAGTLKRLQVQPHVCGYGKIPFTSISAYHCFEVNANDKEVTQKVNLPKVKRKKASKKAWNALLKDIGETYNTTCALNMNYATESASMGTPITQHDPAVNRDDEEHEQLKQDNENSKRERYSNKGAVRDTKNEHFSLCKPARIASSYPKMVGNDVPKYPQQLLPARQINKHTQRLDGVSKSKPNNDQPLSAVKQQKQVTLDLKGINGVKRDAQPTKGVSFDAPKEPQHLSSDKHMKPPSQHSKGDHKSAKHKDNSFRSRARKTLTKIRNFMKFGNKHSERPYKTAIKHAKAFNRGNIVVKTAAHLLPEKHAKKTFTMPTFIVRT